ncbi:type II toxin-antitoxin system TacA family antitoxin [Endothiovibrio diazotrophicus]
MTTPTAEAKTERIDIRTTRGVKEILQRAAAASHKNVSEFLLDAALSAADDALADRRLFQLDDERWHAFQRALERPVQVKPHLARLLDEPSVLE